MSCPEPLADGALFGQRQKASGGDDAVAAHDHRTVVQWRVGIEDRLQHLRGDVAVDPDSGGGVILETDLTLKRDEGTRVLGAQSLGGPDRLRNRLAVQAGVVVRERTAEVADAADLVK